MPGLLKFFGSAAPIWKNVSLCGPLDG